MVSGYKWMIIVAILASILGVVYYLKMVLAMFENDKKLENITILLSKNEWLVVIISVLLLVFAGIYPDIIAYTFKQ
jgi:NADH:ubiquinone oxidoreductase subunit 2 (subunit N)